MIKSGFRMWKYWFSLALLALTGCVDEQGCRQPVTATGELSLTFVYDYNMEGVDRFTEEVRFLDIFIYNENALYESHQLSVAQLKEGNLFHTILPAGNYKVVTWGFSNRDHYRYPTTYGDEPSLLELITDDEGCVREFEALFHSQTQWTVAPGQIKTGEVSLLKNTAKIRVTVEGIDLRHPLQNENEIAVRIAGHNRAYSFDRSLIQGAEVYYLPRYAESVGGQSIVSDFHVQRITEEGYLRLIVLQVVDGQEICNASIPELIRKEFEKNPELAPGVADFTEFLDRQDEYRLKVELSTDDNGSYVLVTVHIENWDPIQKPGTGI